FHAVFFADWHSAEQAARALAQARPGLSMLRLSNDEETRTMLALAGHKTLIGALEKYLSLRGCGDGKCMLMIGASGEKRQARGALAVALRMARRGGGVHIGRKLGDKWKQNR